MKLKYIAKGNWINGLNDQHFPLLLVVCKVDQTYWQKNRPGFISALLIVLNNIQIKINKWTHLEEVLEQK